MIVAIIAIYEKIAKTVSLTISSEAFFKTAIDDYVYCSKQS